MELIKIPFILYDADQPRHLRGCFTFFFFLKRGPGKRKNIDFHLLPHVLGRDCMGYRGTIFYYLQEITWAQIPLNLSNKLFCKRQSLSQCPLMCIYVRVCTHTFIYGCDIYICLFFPCCSVKKGMN